MDWLIWLLVALVLSISGGDVQSQDAPLYWQSIEDANGAFILGGFTQTYGERPDGTAWTRVLPGAAQYTDIPGRAARVCVAPSFGHAVEQRGAVTCWRVSSGYWTADGYVLELAR